MKSNPWPFLYPCLYPCLCPLCPPLVITKSWENYDESGSAIAKGNEDTVSVSSIGSSEGPNDVSVAVTRRRIKSFRTLAWIVRYGCFFSSFFFYYPNWLLTLPIPNHRAWISLLPKTYRESVVIFEEQVGSPFFFFFSRLNLDDFFFFFFLTLERGEGCESWNIGIHCDVPDAGGVF